MDNKIIQFEVASPDELREALARHEMNGARFASVRVFGPRVLTRPFHFPATSGRDLRSGLCMEASEVLSVAVRDIAVAYHVIAEDAGGVHGTCVAMLRQELLEYLACFNESALIPVALTSLAAASMIDFLKEHPLTGPDLCVVNFLKPNVVGITVFADGAPALFCEAYDLSEEDLQEKIINAVRYVCSRSSNKQIGKIFFTGKVQGQENLVEKLKGLEDHAQVQALVSVPLVSGLRAPDFFEPYVLGYEERAAMMRILTTITVACVILGVFLGGQLLNSQARLNKACSTFSMSDYQKAQELKEQVRRLDHEK